MRNITKYFRAAVATLSQGTVEYKKDKFSTISDSELEKGYIGSANYSFLWKEERKKDSEKEKISTKSVIIALKTLATDFSNNKTTESKVEEMVSILFLPASIDINGKLYPPHDGKYPWIPREYLSPMVEPQIAVGNSESYDQYLEMTTDKRNQIDSWKKYLDYAIAMYETVTGAAFKDEFIHKINETIKLDGKYYMFEDSMINTTFHILNLYNHLLTDSENKLYQKITNGTIEGSKPLVKNSNISKMMEHVGQMGGEYPLSASQREAINHLNEIKEGDVLAVSGPPGTGKTTFLQSVVANLYVEAALKRAEAPIIVATSTNNQAVTNIIDSFGKITEVGISNLEHKWITGTQSFATYFPANGKREEARKKGYQFTSVNGGNFVEDLESEENRIFSSEKFKKEFASYFGYRESDIAKCKEMLWRNLHNLNLQRQKCLLAIESLKGILGKKTYEEYIRELSLQIGIEKEKSQKYQFEIEKSNNDIEQCKIRMVEWRESYEKLPWYVRLFCFFSMFKNKVLTWSYSFMETEEVSFLKRDMSIGEIEAAYRQRINDFDLQLNSLMKEKESVEKELKVVKSKKQSVETALTGLKKMYVSLGMTGTEKSSVWGKFDVCELNDLLDRVRYVEFWLAVHYYESCWLIEENPIKGQQKGKTFENVLNQMYHRLAMISPCMVMTFYMLPKQFLAYNSNDKKHYYMYNYIDLLIVDEAGQTSPEIAAPSFSLAKKAVVVGDEEQIPPVWGTTRALDITFALRNSVIGEKVEFSKLEQNGLNCSQSSIMKVALASCAYDKYGKGLFLSEHRRCYDEIIAYCNALVYKNKLEPKRGMFCTAKKNAIKEILPVMGYKQVTTSKSQMKGTSRRNKEEAEAIVLWLREYYDKIVECYRAERQEEFDQKTVLGIITPFKSQSFLINSYIERYLPQYVPFIAVGTVHTFQGAERNVIIFSSVYGNQDGCYFINQSANLMNVAVSRAKDSFLVFGDGGCLSGGKESAAGLLKKMVFLEGKELQNSNTMSY